MNLPIVSELMITQEHNNYNISGAFGDTPTEVIGKTVLQILVDSEIFDIQFLVVNNAAFSCILSAKTIKDLKLVIFNGDVSTQGGIKRLLHSFS